MNEISKQPLSVVAEISAPAKVDSNTQVSSVSSAEKKGNQEQVSPLFLENTASRLNEAVKSIERDLQFTVGDNSGDTIIKVLDKATNEVIRQIPTEEVIAIRENIESLKGILFSAEV